MNNFPAMTEAQRQLAALCKIEIKRWQAASESNPNMRYMAELMEIALAALTAKPRGYIDAGTPSDEINILTENKILKTDIALYTAPPAPVLRVPDEVKRSDAPCHLEAYEADCWVDGASFMREEFQRLNTQTAPPEASNEQ